MQHAGLQGVIPHGDAALAQMMQPAPQASFNPFNAWEGLKNPTINVNLTQSPPPSTLQSLLGNPFLIQLVLGALGALASRFQEKPSVPAVSSKPWNWQASTGKSNPWDWGGVKTSSIKKKTDKHSLLGVEVMKKQADGWDALLNDLGTYVPYVLTGTSLGAGLGGLIPLITYGTAIKKQPDFNRYSRNRLMRAVLFGMLTGAGLGLAGGTVIPSLSLIARSLKLL